jgi:mono/diheme cytochrome c family protein
VLAVAAAVLLVLALSWDVLVTSFFRAPDVPQSSSAVAGLPPTPAIDPALASSGRAVFDAQCARCHGPAGEWPITERLKGRGARDFYLLLDRLRAVNPVMPGFVGTDDQRRALAAYLGALAPTTPAAPRAERTR